MKRTIFIVLCCLAVVFSAGCSRSYSKDLLGSYEELERIMSVYSAQPDKLTIILLGIEKFGVASSRPKVASIPIRSIAIIR